MENKRSLQFILVHWLFALVISICLTLPVQAQDAKQPAAASSESSSSATDTASATADSAGDATPEWYLDPASALEAIKTKRDSIQEQIKAAQAAVDAVTDATVQASLTRKADLIQNLDLIYSQQVSAYEQWKSYHDQLQQMRDDLDKVRNAESEQSTSFLELNRLREQLQAETNRKDSVNNRIDLAQKALDQAKTNYDQRQAQIKEIQIKIDNTKEQPQLDSMQTDFASAQYAARAAQETVDLRRVELLTQKLAKEVYETQLTLLKEQVDRVQDQVTFTEKDLNEQNERLSKEELSLQRDLKQAQDQKPIIEKRLTAARDKLASAPASTPVLQEEVNARQYELRANEVRIEIVNEELKWIPIRKELWRQRYKVFNREASDQEMSDWKTEIQTNMTTLDQLDSGYSMRLEDRQDTLVTIRNNLNNLSDEAADAKKLLQDQEKYLNNIIDHLRQGKSYIEITRRLHDKLQNEISEQLSKQSIEEYLNSIRAYEFYGNTLERWAYVLASFVVFFISIYMIRAILIWRLRRLTEKKPHQRPTLETILELIKRVRPLFFFILAVFLGTQFLALSNEDRDFVSMIMMVALTLQAALMASYFIKQWIWQYLLRKSKRDETSMSALSIFNFISQIIVWSVAVIVVLQNMGQNVTGLVTGLGIGGIAVALAVQQILGDLFGSLSIVLDKPFVHGDFIIFDTFMGTVEKIGIKTTRIRSLTGEQIICSNSDLLNARIRNFKRMQERRVVFAVGVTYQTPADRLEQIPVVLKEVIEARENTRFDRAHFKGFGASSLDFEIVYYVLSPDYNIYMDIQQKINLIIFKRFADMGVEFAYPTQTLHVESAPPFDVRGTVTGPVTLMQDSPNDDTPRTSENAE